MPHTPAACLGSFRIPLAERCRGGRASLPDIADYVFSTKTCVSFIKPIIKLPSMVQTSASARSLVSEVQLRTQANGGFTQIDIPALNPWAMLIVRAAN